jgi:hypothetical protein
VSMSRTRSVSAISGDQLKLKAILATGRWVLKSQD